MTKLLKSWVQSANSPETQFPLNNLPYGVFSVEGGARKCGVAIGDHIVDMAALAESGLLKTDAALFASPSWNAMMEAGADVWAAFRAEMTALLAEGAAAEAQITPMLVAQADATLHMPFVVTEFTDFYASRHHAFNVGTMFRGPENALPPNWLHIPIGYNGRASTVVVSGTDVVRPCGQLKGPNDDAPRWGPCARLDIELELGAIVGRGTEMGTRLTVPEADEAIFGYVLLNDWSARDIQAWEYQPLGPFQAKAFATSISPWIVTREALEPFRQPLPEREKPLLPYLDEEKPGLYDIDLTVDLIAAGANAPTTVSQTNYNEMYYSSAQQLAHHSSSGCAMRPGDLLGSGTISGPEANNRGSFLEISWSGQNPMDLVGGGTRTFLEDGDEVILAGHAQGDGFRVGFGECRGMIKPAVE